MLVVQQQPKVRLAARRARAWDAAAVATGHYARVERDRGHGTPSAPAAQDLRKDQTDFLWPLTQAQLGAARFPIGELTKDEVRARARRLALVTADKPESQDICFVPDDDYRGFLRRRAPEVFRPGAVVDRLGTTLGATAVSRGSPSARSAGSGWRPAGRST